MKYLTFLLISFLIISQANAYDFEKILGKKAEANTVIKNTVTVGSEIAISPLFEVFIGSCSENEVQLISTAPGTGGSLNHYPLTPVKVGGTIIYRPNTTTKNIHPALQIKLIAVDLEKATVTMEIRAFWP